MCACVWLALTFSHARQQQSVLSAAVKAEIS